MQEYMKLLLFGSTTSAVWLRKGLSMLESEIPPEHQQRPSYKCVWTLIPVSLHHLVNISRSSSLVQLNQSHLVTSLLAEPITVVVRLGNFYG